jgi:hypothetical protein
MALDRSWLPLSENLNHHPRKTNHSSRRCIWRHRFQAGVWNCQILNHVASQLFTSLWNIYHQWISDIEFIQTGDSSFWINPCFTAGKWSGVWNCHITRGHRKTTIFTSIVYGTTHLLKFPLLCKSELFSAKKQFALVERFLFCLAKRFMWYCTSSLKSSKIRIACSR